MADTTSSARRKGRKLASGARRSSSKALRVQVERVRSEGQALVTQPVAPRGGAVWYDYTDLIHYFEDNRVPTGIQRVQIGIFRASLERRADQAADRTCACSFDAVRRCWVAVPEAVLVAVCRAACHAATTAEGQVGNADSWHKLTDSLRQAIATGAAAAFSPGDVLVNIGTSWWIPDYLRYVEHLQRERGVLYAPYLHDCIPLRRPDLCAAGLVGEFREWFADAMRVADMVLANSAHTARDVVHFAAAIGAPPVEPLVVRLDARFDDGPQPGPTAVARLDALTHARLGINRPFALFVATVEARKNHVFVFECWKSLIEKHGDAVPDLICVGKLGWLVEYTLNWLKVHPELAHRVRLVGTISDLDLSALYRTALFTVYCSHYEGWGLPVTESLCHGRVSIVPRHSSLPEAGGTFAIYYQPGSHAEFRAAVECMMTPRERQRAEARIQARFRPRAWKEVLGQITEAVRTAPVRQRPSSPAMQPGRIYTMARPLLAEGAPYASGHALAGLPLKHGIGWHAAEEWGSWSRLAEAQLLLRLPEKTDVNILYMVLRGGPAEAVVTMRVGAAAACSIAVQPGRRRLVRLPLQADSGGREVLVTLGAPPYSLKPFTGGGDPRDVGVGLEALVVTDRRDTAARLDLLEAMVALD